MVTLPQKLGNKTVTRVLFNLLVIVILFTGTFTPLFLVKAYSSIDPVMEPGTQVETASYVVWCEGSTYYAKNGATGEVTRNTDERALILSTITALSSGGRILLKSGVHTWKATIAVTQSNLIIEGEGASSIIYGQGLTMCAFHFTNCQNSIVRNLAFKGQILAGENHALAFGNCENILVEGCYFEDIGDESVSLGKGSRNAIIRGNWFLNGPVGAAAGMITLQSGHHLIEGNTLIADGGDGFAIHFETVAVTTEIIETVCIKNNKIYGGNTLEIGIYLHGLGFNINDIIIEGNQIYDCIQGGITDGFDGSTCVNRVNINNNLIRGGGGDATARGAIQILKNSPTEILINGNTVSEWGITNLDAKGIACTSANAIISNNKITRCGEVGIRAAGNRIEVSGNEVIDAELASSNGGIRVANSDGFMIIGNIVENCYRGINLDANALNGLVTNNNLVNCTVPINGSGTAKIKQNLGYVTENTGTATIPNTGTSIVVNHGCSYTPSINHIMVMAAENPSNDVGSLWISNIGATQFTINCENDPGASNLDVVWWINRTP